MNRKTHIFQVPNKRMLGSYGKKWRELTQRHFKKNGKCWRCGFKANGEVLEISPDKYLKVA